MSGPQAAVEVVVQQHLGHGSGYLIERQWHSPVTEPDADERPSPYGQMATRVATSSADQHLRVGAGSS